MRQHETESIKCKIKENMVCMIAKPQKNLIFAVHGMI